MEVHTQCAIFTKPENKQNHALFRQMQLINTQAIQDSDPSVVKTQATEKVLGLELSGGFTDAVLLSLIVDKTHY